MPVLKVFTVNYGGIRIKVKVLPTVADVHREHQDVARRCRPGSVVMAFFLPAQRAARHVGTIVLPLDKRLPEFIPHEVTHAVLHKMGGVLSADDEKFATAVGRLTASIHRKIGAVA